jgi:hypothetical protein
LFGRFHRLTIRREPAGWQAAFRAASFAT